MKKALGFLLRMNMILCVLVCVVQITAFFTGSSSFVQATLVVAAGTALTYKMTLVERELRRRKTPQLRVVEGQRPPRAA